MAKAKNFNLGEETEGILHDICEAHYGAPEVRIIREAVKLFVEESLKAEPELKKRFKAAQQKRLGENVRALRLEQ